MRHTATKSVFRHWRQVKGARIAPDRSAINPADFGASLADIFLLERKDGAIRFRLAGSRVCSLFGAELRDVPFESLFAQPAYDDARDMIAAVTEDQTPVIAGIAALFPERLSHDGELLLLPLTHASGSSSDLRILGALVINGHRPAAQPPCAALDILSFRMLAENDQTRLLTATTAPPEEAPAADPIALRRARFRVYEGGLGR